MAEALDTRQKIWLTYRTYQRKTSGELHRCNYVVRTKREGYSYEFDQHFMYGPTRDDQHFYIDINRGSEGEPVLLVKNRTASPGVLYTMRFWDARHHCFVLTATLDDKTQCEMHVWDEDIQKLETLYDCMQDFERLCGGKKFFLYTSDCK
uniref:Putative lipocalin-2 25 lipocalin n=1 Tax=Amblyomma sculptum TaxID=1581419 RepID=A0A1E1XV96_AMBSC